MEVTWSHFNGPSGTHGDNSSHWIKMLWWKFPTIPEHHCHWDTACLLYSYAWQGDWMPIILRCLVGWLAAYCIAMSGRATQFLGLSKKTCWSKELPPTMWHGTSLPPRMKDADFHGPSHSGEPFNSCQFKINRGRGYTLSELKVLWLETKKEASFSWASQAGWLRAKIHPIWKP